MSKKVKKIIMIVVDIIVILLALYFVLGYINFNKISHDEKPVAIYKENTYNTEDGIVTVYDSIIYKIVRYEIPGKNITMRLKLWLMKDVE